MTGRDVTVHRRVWGTACAGCVHWTPLVDGRVAGAPQPTQLGAWYAGHAAAESMETLPGQVVECRSPCLPAAVPAPKKDKGVARGDTLRRQGSRL